VPIGKSPSAIRSPRACKLPSILPARNAIVIVIGSTEISFNSSLRKRSRVTQARVAGAVDLAHSTRADAREDLVGAETVSRRHCAAAPFFSSAGQLTIKVSG
jgi:hypothetical protein